MLKFAPESILYILSYVTSIKCFCAMRKCLIFGTLALVAGLYLASCTDHDTGYDSLYDEKIQTFEKVFNKLYGPIDPQHNWGFTPISVYLGGTTTADVQALTRGHDANANEWATTWVVPDPLTEAQKDKVRRYFQAHPNPEGVAFDYANFFVQQVYKGGDKVGANSPEKYTAADGITTMVGSNQMDKLTCGSYSAGAESLNYYDHINNFNNGTATWNNNVLNNGQPVNGGSKHSDQIMLMVNSKSDCFGYWNSNGSVGFNNRYVIIPGSVIQEWDGSGGSNANVSGMWFVGFDFEQLIDDDVYANEYYNFNGKRYRYLNSSMNRYCGDKKEYNNTPSASVIQGLLDEGYLPVAGKADKVFVKLSSCADGYYSDWIVRVIPGTKRDTSGDKDKDKEETTTSKKYTATIHRIMSMGRVFVEDLYKATREDLDYNDAVFDAIIWQDGKYEINEEATTDAKKYVPAGAKTYRVEIALLAAGGTIPLKIAGSKFGDVHDSFGVGMTTVVNTVGEASNVAGTLSRVTGQPYVYKMFDYTSELGGTNYTINNIPIDVKWATDEVTVGARLNNKEIHEYKKDENGNFVLDSKGNLIIVNSGTQSAPHILLAPIGTPWVQERVNIRDAYTRFPTYVGNRNTDVWGGDVENFNLYGDNRSPLAYADKYQGWFYMTDIEEISPYEGTQLWVGPKKGQFEVSFSGSILANATSKSKIRIYLTSSTSTSYWHIALQKKDWSGAINIPEWGNSNTISYNPQPQNFPGYVEFKLSSSVKSAIVSKGGFVIQTANNNNPFSIDCITYIP